MSAYALAPAEVEGAAILSGTLRAVGRSNSYVHFRLAREWQSSHLGMWTSLYGHECICHRAGWPVEPFNRVAKRCPSLIMPRWSTS